MTLNELGAIKLFSLASAVTAGTAFALADAMGNIPIEWGTLVAVGSSIFVYGRLTGKIEEREKARLERIKEDDKRYKRMSKSMQYTEAAVTRIAETHGIHLADLHASYQEDE